MGALVQDLLVEDGWNADEPWTPLRRDLTEPVEDPGVRIEVIGPERAHVRAAVQRAVVRRVDVHGRALARDGGPGARRTPTPGVWSRTTTGHGGGGGDGVVGRAGEARAVEPMGVHREHRGRGYGKAITVAAAAALQELGSSSAIVCTPSSNVGAVATYRSAGFRRLPEVRDLRRDA